MSFYHYFKNITKREGLLQSKTILFMKINKIIKIQNIVDFLIENCLNLHINKQVSFGGVAIINIIGGIFF